MFQELLETIKEDFTRTIFHMSRVPVEEQAAQPEKDLQYSYDDGTTSKLPQQAPSQQTTTGGADEKQEVAQRVSEKVGRNDPCPCGSGKKYKKCCGV